MGTEAGCSKSRKDKRQQGLGRFAAALGAAGYTVPIGGEGLGGDD